MKKKKKGIQTYIVEVAERDTSFHRERSTGDYLPCHYLFLMRTKTLMWIYHLSSELNTRHLLSNTRESRPRQLTVVLARFEKYPQQKSPSMMQSFSISRVC